MNIRIYQIDMDKDVERVQFKNLENTLNIAGRVNPAIYSQVYANVCDCNNLEDVYCKFNVGERPTGFTGHSLSVSDIVEILDEENKGTYFCDSFGFKKIDFDTSAVCTSTTHHLV